MATYQGSFRRGLPRASGGDYWPPEEAIMRSVASVPVALESSAVKSTQHQFGRDAMGGASVAVLEHPSIAVEDPVSGVAESLPVTGAAKPPTNPLQELRRGLPRIPGGELWPAEHLVAVTQGIGSTATPKIPVTSPAGNAVADSQGTTEKSVASTVDQVSTQAQLARPVGAGESSRELRRGLPRVAGGEPYPAYTLAHAHEVVAANAAGPANVELAESAPAEATPAILSVSSPSVPKLQAQTAPAPINTPQAKRTATPAASASAPVKELKTVTGLRLTLSANKYKNAAIWTAILLVQATLVVLAAKGVASFESARAFIERYPGETHLPAGDTTGLPGWVRWQHFLNLFFLVLIIRSGLQIRREQRPSAFWTPSWTKGGAGKVSLTVWFHQLLDMLWLINGAVFVTLMFVTDHWMRIVPTSWEVFPNAVSAMLQYVSLDWPTENGWVNYNSLQQLMYALTIFVAAPLAAATGIRMSSLWPKNAKKLTSLYRVEVARAIHFPVMLYFVFFVIVHVALVFSTGALRNLNHMYAGQDVMNWTGLLIFLGSVLLIAGAWMAARPIILAPIASLMGKVSSR